MKSFIIILLFLLTHNVMAYNIDQKHLSKDGKAIVRVKIASSLNQIDISGTDLQREMFGKQKWYSGRKKIRFKCNGDNLRPKRSHPVLLASVNSPTGLISWGKKKYTGRLKIVTNPYRQTCDLIQETHMEHYISSLLAKEMNSTWPIEALKAQAVAARTYALHKMESRQVSRKLGSHAYYDLESSERHQVSGNFFESTASTSRATIATEGEILLTKDDQLVPTFFHAKCGGHTFRPSQIWDGTVKGYKGVKCPFDRGRGKQRGWKAKISLVRMENFINYSLKHIGIKKINIKNSKLPWHLVLENRASAHFRLYIGEKFYIFKKALLRRYFGRVMIKSNYFRLKLTKRGNFIMSGFGRGHGVGLCQLGALELADRGLDYRQILTYYFPNLKLAKIY